MSYTHCPTHMRMAVQSRSSACPRPGPKSSLHVPGAHRGCQLPPGAVQGPQGVGGIPIQPQAVVKVPERQAPPALPHTCLRASASAHLPLSASPMQNPCAVVAERCPLYARLPCLSRPLAALMMVRRTLISKVWLRHQRQATETSVNWQLAGFDDDCVFAGGHFAAMEEPELLAEDIIKFFSRHH